MKLTAKATDTAACGLITNPGSSEGLKATGRFLIECYDKDGNFKWADESKNLVVNVGLQYMAGSALTSTAQITTWYLGLYGAAPVLFKAPAKQRDQHQQNQREPGGDQAGVQRDLQDQVGLHAHALRLAFSACRAF